MMMADELLKLQQLRDTGALTEEEFQRAKEKLMAEDAAESRNTRSAPRTKDIERERRQWAFFIHISQFGCFAFPLVGIILPIVLWQMKKDEMPGIDAHGRVVLNWMISLIIYGAICALLCFLLIGIPLLLALGLAAIIFPIIGAIKANDGVLWKYPMSIEFLSIETHIGAE
jgi:uncharacterized Tic20 family protein